MMNRKIKINLSVTLLSVSFLAWVGCATQPKSSPERSVASVGSSIQGVEILDVNASLQGAKSEAGNPKEEDQLKFKKIQLDQVEKLTQLKATIDEIQKRQDEISAEYDLKKSYFKSLKVAERFAEELLQSGKSIQELRTERRFFDLVNILNALRNRADSSKEELVEVTRVFKLYADHTQKPSIDIPKNVDQLPDQPRYPLSDDAYKRELVRAPIFDPASQVCTYAGPKTGYGFKAGLKIQCGEQKLKLKFGPEAHSGPFNSRLFRASGILTPRIDHVPQVEMKYDRRFITEFNSRKATRTSFKALGIKVAKDKEWNTEIKNPMSYLRAIKLKDGSVLTGNQLADFGKGLYVSPNKQSFTFNEAKESQIDTVTFVAGSVVEDIDALEVGPWRFDEENHMNNPMLRSQYMLSVWVGNNDMPMNNNRLLILKSPGSEKNENLQVLPVYLDVGVGLGPSETLGKLSSYDIEKMSASMSARETSSQGDSQGRVILQFLSKTPTKIIEKMTFLDAINGLNMMCRFDSEQLKAALLQAGIPENLSTMAADKLISRRAKLIQDLGVQKQFSSCL